MKVKTWKKRKNQKKQVKYKKLIFIILYIENNFNNDFLEALNNLRKNPQQFADKVISAISYIKTEEGKSIFEMPNGAKIALVKGEEAFRECADKLRHNIPKLEPFEFKDDLVISVPEDSKEWKKNDLIVKTLGEMKKNLKDKYTDFYFNLDMGVNEAEMSLVLQIVDDSNFKGRRSSNLLSKDLKYIGISHASKGKKSFCVYVVFAK